MAVPAEFYRLDGVERPWGDYGSLLAHGMTSHLPRQDGSLQLERTGPAIDPITFPFAIVVTDTVRQALEKSGLTGFGFQPVHKARIVELSWEDWDVTAEEPELYPESGEPEDYILARPHSPAAAKAMGPLWELTVQVGIEVERSKEAPLKPSDLKDAEARRRYFGSGIRLRAETWNGTDFFGVRSTAWVAVSPRARDWLLRHYADYIDFVPCRT